MMLSSTAEKLMADPVGWIHPSRTGVADDWCQGLPRGIINKIVVQQFSLDQAMDVQDDGGLIHAVIDNWFLLPEAAWYMACQRYREQLLHSAQPLYLTGKTRCFMMLNIVTPMRYGQQEIDTQALWQLAYGEMLPLFPLLPEAVTMRITLLFPQWVERGNPVATDSFDSVLFFMAIQHARKYSAAI